MKKIITTGLLLLSSITAFAETPKEINAAFKVSTLGFGIDASTPINEIYSMRLNINNVSFSDTQTSDGNTYDGTLNLFTAGLLLDAYPFQNNFRLSTGVYYNDNGYTGTITPSLTQTIEINGINYTSTDITKVNMDVIFDKVAPYFGIGWGNDARDKGWGFTCDLGVLYHGKGTVNLNADINNPLIATQINNGLIIEEQNINNNLSDFQLYPVVSIGINRSF